MIDAAEDALKKMRSSSTKTLINRYKTMNEWGRRNVRIELKKRGVKAKDMPYTRRKPTTTTGFGFSVRKPRSRFF
jgi:hypothetical protein